MLAAYRDLNLKDAPECRRGVEFLLSVQNADGGWGGAKDCPSSVEETALAVEVLLDLTSPPEEVAGDAFGSGGWGGSRETVQEHAAEQSEQPSGVLPSPSPPTRRSAAHNGDLPLKGGGQDKGRGQEAVTRGVAWLVDAVESGRFREASPIGFYFAKLWYFEKLYPLIFTVAALGRAVRHATPSATA